MRQIDVHKLADEARFNRFHGLVLFWCALIIIFDGYDLAVVGHEQALVSPVNGARCESVACIDLGCTGENADFDAERAA